MAVGGRNMDKLEKLADEIGGLTVQCDITSMAEIRSSVTMIIEEFGQLDTATVINLTSSSIPEGQEFSQAVYGVQGITQAVLGPASVGQGVMAATTPTG